MKLIGRLLALLVVLLAAALGVEALRRGAEAWVAVDGGTLERLAAGDSSLVYMLDDGRWTEFPLSGAPEAVRLVAHADLPATLARTPDTEWRYAVAYRFHGPGGEIVHERVRHYRSSVRMLRETESGTAAEDGPVFVVSYVDAEAVPTAATPATLSLEGLGPVSAISARIDSRAEGVEGVGLRVYQRKPMAERRARSAWVRLTEEQRDRLVAGSAYPPALIDDAGRRAAVARRWLPVGPGGIEGDDYAVRSMISLEGAPVQPPRLPAGLYVGPDHDASLRLPETGAELAISLAPLTGDRAVEGELAAEWFGPGPGRRESRRLDWRAPPGGWGRVQARFEGGFLLLSSRTPVMLDVERADGRSLDEAEPVYLRGWSAGPERSVTFSATRLPGEPETPLRVDLRCLCFSESAAAATLVIRHEFIGAAGEVIASGMVERALTPSRLDRVAGRAGGGLSEAVPLHFALPPEVQGLRISAGREALVTGYTRPPHAPRLARIPEDNFAAPEEHVRQPSWFGARPEGWRELLAAGRSELLTVQPRPPEADPEILAGRYDWEQFLPEGDWLARDLLVPRQSAPLRRLALSSIFSRLPAGEETAMVVTPVTPGPAARPDLLYLRPERGPARIALSVDGTSILDESVGARRGVLRLPPVATGPRIFRAEAPEGATIWINEALPSEDALLRRRAIRLRPGRTVFEIDKTAPGEEMLAIAIYGNPGQVRRQTIEVSIEEGRRDPGPHDSWTVLDRRYDVRFTPEPADATVLGSDEMAGPERDLFFPLGADLPPGRYRLAVMLPEGPELYLSLTRTTPGLVAERRLEREDNMQEDPQ